MASSILQRLVAGLAQKAITQYLVASPAFNHFVKASSTAVAKTVASLNGTARLAAKTAANAKASKPTPTQKPTSRVHAAQPPTAAEWWTAFAASIKHQLQSDLGVGRAAARGHPKR